MGLLGNLFGNKKTRAEERLSTGETNWRLKPNILAVKEFPNYLKFISKLEEENNIQIGLTNDVSNDLYKTLVLKQIIYSKNNTPTFYFTIIFQFIKQIGTISFMGTMSPFLKPNELSNLKRENFVTVRTNSRVDLDTGEYEKHYRELLKSSLSIQGFDPSEYMIKGIPCAHREMERKVREGLI